MSDAGVKALRSVLRENEQFSEGLKSRCAKSIRGLGYRSQFIRDFNSCTEILGHFSAIAGTPLGPHDMTMNMSHTNIGEIGADQPVDTWHIDSVPYVCVLLLSDATDMVGGELQVAMLGDPTEAIDRVRVGDIKPSDIEMVNYPGPGYCIFMQGSR